MRHTQPRRRRLGRLLLPLAACGLSLLSCGREVTGPENGVAFGRTRVAALSLDPEMPSLLASLVGGSRVVPFERVRVVLRRQDGSVAADTLVPFPSAVDSIAVNVLVPLPLNATDAGIPLSLTMAYVNAQGDTVFRAGPQAVTARPIGATGANTPVRVPTRYSGPGANAARVAISPDTLEVVAGATTVFTAQAFDGQNAVLDGTPFVFFTLDSARAVVPSPGAGAVTWLANRGLARVVAALPDGLRADTAFVSVTLPASQLVSQNAQPLTGTVGQLLGAPLVFRTLASDSVPVAGVVVQFAVATGGGTLSVAVDTSDAAGEVSTAWTLGTVPGVQTITATATGLANSPITIAATAAVGAPVAITRVDGEGQSGAVSTTLPAPIRARVTDAFGNGVPDVPVQWATASGAATPVDSVSLTNAAGIAQTTVQLGTTVGPAVLEARNASLVGSPVSFAVTVTNGPAVALRVSTQPLPTVTAGAPITMLIGAYDAVGNLAADFAGTITASVDSGPAAAVLGGTVNVAAVAGSAAFTNLTLDLAGTYRLRVSSTGLADTITVPFSVTPAAAASLLLLDGDAQADTVGSALPSPLRVSVTDLFGNPVAGTAVAWSIVAGGGSLGADTTVTNAAGVASNTLTLPTAAGVVTVQAAATGLAGSPIGFAATGIPAAAATLVLTSAPDTVAAGALIPPIVAEVRDAFGNVVTWFTESFTIAPSDAPGSIALGTTTRAAAAGVVTFDDLVVNEVGGWFLEISNGALSAFADFTVIPGAPASFTRVAGDGQVGPATLPLPVPLRVRLLDGAGNPVVGRTVTFTVGAGGGTLSSGLAVDSVATDGAGEASTIWTLGLDTLAAQTVSAAYPGLPSLTFTATAEALVANRTWTGAVSTVWENAGNWAENVLPTAADSVLIPAGLTFYPELGSSPSIGRLTIEDGASLNLSSFTLTVGGHLRAPSTLAVLDGGEAALVMSGTSTLRGALPFLIVTGNVTVASATSVASFLLVDGGNLTVGPHALTAGQFETQNGGTLTMTDPLGSLVVDGGAAFFGGSTVGRLTAGQLVVRGDFTVANLNVNAFSPSAAHTVVLDGPAVQTVFFDEPDTTLTASCATSCFGTLSVPKTVGTGGVVFLSSAKALGTMSFTGDSVSAPGHALVSTGAPAFLVNGTMAARVAWQDGYTFSGTFFVDTLVAWGTGSALPVSENIPTIVAGTHRIVGPFNAGLVVEGTLDVDGRATLNGTLDTRASGQLRMTDASDTLVVVGAATFAGTVAVPELTNGVLEFQADVTQIGVGRQSLRADSPLHVTRFTGTTATITVDALALNPLGVVRVADGTTLTIAGGGLALNYDVILEGTTAAVTGSGGTVYFSFGGLVDSVGGRWTYANTQFGAANPVLPSAIGGNVSFTNAVTLAGNLAIAGGLAIAGSDAPFDVAGHTLSAASIQTSLNGRLVMDAAEDSVLISGNAFFLGGQSVLTGGYLEIGGSFTQSDNGRSFQAAAPHETRLVGAGGGNIEFGHPGFGPDSSHFGILYHAKSVGSAVTLLTDAFVNGAFETGGLPTYAVNGTNTRLVSRGAEATDVTFSNARWEIVDGAPVTPLTNITFTGMDPDVTQFAVQRAGGTVTIADLTFGTVPTNGLYLRATDTDPGNADDLIVTITSVSPATADGFAVADAPATITGWPGVNAGDFPLITWTGAVDANWSTAGNWTLGRTPLPGDSVVINPGDASTVNLDVSATVAYLDLGGVGTPTLTHVGGSTLQVDSIAILYAGSNYVLSGGATLTGDGSVLAFGSLSLNGATLSGTGVTSIGGTGSASIAQTGPLTITDRALVVQGIAEVGGAGIASGGEASISVANGGFLDFQERISLFRGGTETLGVSDGTVRFSPPSTDSVRVDWDLTVASSDGGGVAVDVASGYVDLVGAIYLATVDSLVVRSGATLRSRDETEVLGAWHVEAGGVARLTGGGLGTHTFYAGSVLSGGGTLAVDAANTVTLGGAVDIGTLTLQNATLDLVGSDTVFVGGGGYLGGGFLNGTGVLAIRGAFSSTGGNPNGTGTIAVLPGGQLTWNSPLRGWNLDVGGTMIWGDWSLSLEQFNLQNPAILIRSGGLLDIQHGSTGRDMFANSTNIITNQGTIRKSSGTATTLIRTQLDHQGFLDALSGTLSFQFACTVNGGTFGTGGGTIVNCGP